MREILFRGKRTDNGEWVEGGFLPEGGDFTNVIYEIGSGFGDKVDPLTVGQYTGVTDWNGKRIFEGDYISGRKYKGVVNFGTGCFCVKDGNYFSNLAIDIVINEDVVVVIGNIYDNPDLLGGAGDETDRRGGYLHRADDN